MPGSAEKSQLIPVVSTILKLSPSEVTALQKVVTISESAEAGMAASASTASEVSEVGWTSYLGLWSS